MSKQRERVCDKKREEAYTDLKTPFDTAMGRTLPVLKQVREKYIR